MYMLLICLQYNIYVVKCTYISYICHVYAITMCTMFKLHAICIYMLVIYRNMLGICTYMRSMHWYAGRNVHAVCRKMQMCILYADIMRRMHEDYMQIYTNICHVYANICYIYMPWFAPIYHILNIHIYADICIFYMQIYAINVHYMHKSQSNPGRAWCQCTNELCEME